MSLTCTRKKKERGNKRRGKREKERKRGRKKIKTGGKKE
jgi:hypothetical protein